MILRSHRYAAAISQAAAAEKRLGYFAAAWRCRVVIGGVPHDGAWSKSRRRAEHAAAEAALVSRLGGAAEVVEVAAQHRRENRGHDEVGGSTSIARNEPSQSSQQQAPAGKRLAPGALMPPRAIRRRARQQ
jgi:hypothetical protein